MINLITQYNYLNAKGEPFPDQYSRGWDGANRPDLFHIIVNNKTKTLVELGNNLVFEPYEWSGIHLNSFRLELIYE